MIVTKYKNNSSKELKKLKISIPNKMVMNDDETTLCGNAELFIDKSLKYKNYTPIFKYERRI